MITAEQKHHIGVSADEVALVRTTSEANNIINNGLPLAAGAEMVVWGQNHPTNNVAWDVRAARFGITVTRVSTPVSPTVLLQSTVGVQSLTDLHARVWAVI